jgi:transcription elongation factor Elf1
MEQLIEKQFYCPYCGEPITMLVDLSVDSQIYIEDCEVCCRPMEIRYKVRSGDLKDFSADSIQ